MEDSARTRSEEEYRALRLALLGRKRAAVIQLCDQRRIDDSLLRQLQGRFDIEELRLAGSDPDSA